MPKTNKNKIEIFLNKFLLIDYLIKLIAILIILFIVLEISSFFLARLYFRNIGEQISNIDIYTNEDKDWVVQEYLEENSIKFRYFPYVGHRGIPDYKGEYVNLDNNSIRYTTNPCVSNDSLKIFVFGGSTIFGSRARDNATIPSFLSQELCSKNISVNITNFGDSGYVNTQEIFFLQTEILKNNKPDIVIFYDGGNDIFSSYQNNKAGLPHNVFQREQDFNSRNKLNLKNYLLNTNFVKILREILSKISPKKIETFIRPELANETIKIYLTNIEIIKNLEKPFKFKAFFYWQPTVFTKSNLSEFEKTKISKEPIPMFQPPARLYIDATEIIQSEKKVKDLSGIFNNNTETIFIDWVHISEKGNKIIAKEIAKDIENFEKNRKLFKLKRI